jgi:hypothetical protein
VELWEENVAPLTVTRQQIAFLNQKTGDCVERRLNHRDGKAEKLYGEQQQRGGSVRLGMKASG